MENRGQCSRHRCGSTKIEPQNKRQAIIFNNIQSAAKISALTPIYAAGISAVVGLAPPD
jgi:hypothetical protein